MKVRTLIFVLLFVPHYLGATSLTEEGRVNMVNVEKKYIPLSQEELLEPLRKKEVLAYATLVNDYFMKKYPDVGAYSNVGNRKRDSKIWTRGVYYEGLLAMYVQSPKPEWLKYAVDWANFHHWKIGEGKAARHADYQCCGQAYLDLYMLDTTKVYRKVHVKEMIDEMLATDKIDDWHWVDALQMAMPIFAQLGTIEKDTRYFDRMYEMYMYTRNKQGGEKRCGGKPLFNEQDGLWYRDYRYDPPYTDMIQNDKPCYWSRGNGWAYVALARVLHYLPDDISYTAQYIDDFVLMSKALLKCQRPDGFWSVSLAAPFNTGDVRSPGPEVSGTALFIAGMAYGVKKGILEKEVYLPAVIKAWNSLTKIAVRQEYGLLGYVQGAGSQPEHGQPTLKNCVPDFEDFGIGCFLLAAAEIYNLATE